jgi:hypothetical protein
MASTLTLLTDILRHRQKTAIRGGKIDINRVRGEIARGGYVDRDFIQICASIEKTGEAMVDDWLASCADAADQRYSTVLLRKSAHDLIGSFIVAAKSWRRIPDAFAGYHTTNRYMDEELEKVCERLGARFDDGQNRLALKPKKKWHELNPKTWAIILLLIGGIITGVVSYTNFAAQTVTKPLIEAPAKAASAPK